MDGLGWGVPWSEFSIVPSSTPTTHMGGTCSDDIIDVGTVYKSKRGYDSCRDGILVIERVTIDADLQVEQPPRHRRSRLQENFRAPRVSRRRVLRFGFRVSGFGFRVSGFGFRVSGFGLRVAGFGFRVSGFGFQISGSVLFWWGAGAACRFRGQGSGPC